jgi:predicted nucleotide-binding protein
MQQVTSPVARELLAQYVRQGEALVQRASLVGDFSDYESWKAARKQWIAPTVQALEHLYGGSSEAQEFSSAVTPAESGQRWQQQYATDLSCVKAAIELLIALQGDLALASGAGGSPAPVAELAARSQEPWEHGAETGGHQQFDRAERAEEPEGAEEPERAEDPERADEPERVQEPAIAHEPVREPAPDMLPTHHEQAPTAGDRPLEEPLVGSQLAPAPTAGVASQLAEHLANGAVSAAAPAGSPAAAPTRTRQVFVAHGRNEHWKQAVAGLLERAGGHEVTILNERQSEPRTLVQQLGERVVGSHYAVVLLTADDIGGPRLDSEEEPYFSPRARQAVVFEMGFLVAALTPGRVCVLYEDGVELPCEIDGISYLRLDLGGTWQAKLLLRLRRAGFDYDLNVLAPV